MLGFGLAVGYVLGTRDGRERYDQLRSQAQKLWENPRVAGARRDLEAYARQQAPVIRERAEAAAKAAPGVARDAAAKVADTAKDVADRVGDTAQDLADRVTGTVRDVADRARSTARSTADRAMLAAGQARENALDHDEDPKG